MWGQGGGHGCVSGHLCGVRGQFVQSILSFHYVNSRDKMKVTWLDGKYFRTLNHFPDSYYMFESFGIVGNFETVYVSKQS